MKKLLFIMLAILLAGPVWSQSAGESASPEDAAPMMGPPPELQEMAGLVGTWDVAMQFRWTPDDTVWAESNGTCEFSFTADGAALMMTYETVVQKMPYVGVSLQCFDRETGQWQSVWTDNMGARLSFYTGGKTDDKLVMTGEEMFQGVKSLGRLTTYNFIENSFDWQMESSYDGGDTFAVMGKAHYTKRQ